MRKQTLFALIAAALLALAFTAPALAQGIIRPQHSDPAWEASYWNNTDLSGPVVLQRSDADINFDWGNGSPDPSIAADGFSARWTRYLDTAGGTYRFTVTADDGIRVAIDGRWIINQWHDQAASTYSADVSLGSGHHLVVVEYYENGDRAVARLSWGPAATETIKEWRGEYFTNKTLSGAPALVRNDAGVNFDWGSGSPAPGVIGNDNFSVRWTRTVNLSPGMYRFAATADDGVRLWVNNHVLIDAWQDQPARTYTGEIYLPGGATSIRMEYYENAGSAVARLSWNGGGTKPPPPPQTGAVIVDDTDAGFVKGGSPTGWRSATEGYGDHLTWTRNNDSARANYNWARWYPDLAPGRYEVFVFIPERYSTTSGARYWIHHAGGYTQRVVNQSANGNRWVSLGTYQFAGTDDDYLSLSDVTYESYVSRLIAFDAARWVPR